MAPEAGRRFEGKVYPEDVFDQVLAVNVKGVWHGLKAVTPLPAPGAVPS